MLQRYGFIVKAPGYDAKNANQTMVTKGFITKMVGVSSDDEAMVVAKEMIADGIEVIELCGGFGEQSAQKIIAALDSNVPIGYVCFSESENRKLEDLFAQGEGK